MPIFDYKCRDCGNVFEVIAFRSEESNKPCCDKCPSENVERKLAVPATYWISGENSASVSPKRHNNRF